MRSRLLLLLAALMCAIVSTPCRAQCLAPVLQETMSIARSAAHLETADFNGDAKPDLVGSSATGVFVALNNGGGFAAPADVFIGSVSGGSVAADFDHDGNVDLAIASGQSIFVIAGKGDGTFKTPVETKTGIAPATLAVATADHDLYPDLITYDAAQSVLAVFAGSAAGTLTETSRKMIGASVRSLLVADVDRDGTSDAIVAYAGNATYDEFCGRGDGTLTDAAIIRGSALLSGTWIAMAAGDLTGDTLLDLVTMNSFRSLTTIRNLDGRTFSDPLSYTQNIEGDLALADVTNDGILDVVLSTHCGVRDWRGTGIGTLTMPWVNEASPCTYSSYDPSTLTTADIDGDGRIDVVLSVSASAVSAPVMRVYRNRCGESRFNLVTESPTITLGQSVTMAAGVSPVISQSYFIAGTGRVTLREGERLVASGTLSSSSVRFVVDGLSPGDHTFVATYEGDDQYVATDSTPLTVHVTPETTETTISVDPAHGVYGALPRVTATVTSSTVSAPTGPIRFTFDGNRMSQSFAAPVAAVDAGSSSVGTHTYSAEFVGDATHPPSSRTIEYPIDKQTPRITFSPLSGTAGLATSVSISVLNRYNYGEQPKGSLDLAEGSSTYASPIIDSTPFATVTVPPLAAGRHDLSVRYAGNSNYAATQTIIPFIVFSPAEYTIDARGTASGINVQWSGSGLSIIRRKRPADAWSSAFAMCCTSPPWVDTYAAAETVYLYRADAYNNPTSVSLVDVGMRIEFTDDPLLPGMVIRAVHMQEIIRAANILRTAAGLPQLVSDGFATGLPVTAAALTSVRGAINEARVALGAYAFPFTGVIEAGQPISAAHFRELREAVR